MFDLRANFVRWTIAVSTFIALLLMPLAVFAAEAVPAVPVPIEDDPFKLIQQLVAAASVKNWLLVVPLALILVMYVFRRFVGPKIPFLTTDRGGALMSLIVAVLTAFLSAVVLPGPHSAVAVITASLTALFGNQLVWSYINKLVNPKGKDKAQELEVKVAALEAKLAAVASGTPAATVTNDAVTDLKGMTKDKP